MKQFANAFAVCCIIASCASNNPLAAQDANSSADGSKLRVGTFDSRLIATAYVRSDAFTQRLAKMKNDLEEARAGDDEKRIQQLEAKFPALQERIHKQGFSTWPVRDILQEIQAELPGIAAKAEVDMIVSKWEVVFQRDGVETIDVTDLMVAPFKPDKETRKILNTLRSKKPVPSEALEQHD